MGSLFSELMETNRIATCVFIPIVFWRKTYYLAFTDTVNVLCCAFLGSVIHLGIIRTKLREMIQRHYIEQQRDMVLHVAGEALRLSFPDAALYSAKNMGRNRYVFYSDLHLEKEA